jgi:hypothetical protein
MGRNEETPKYVIEREIPDAGSLTQEQVLPISQNPAAS